MDFDVFSKQDWPGFKQTHSASTRVVMPDGSVVTGIARHTQDMIAMFGYLPDLRVEEHSVKVAAGDWTAVVGRFTGTFSRPMPLPGGGSIPPTGKTVHMPMATFARWEDGQIAEEILFWDSGEFMKQLGLAQ